MKNGLGIGICSNLRPGAAFSPLSLSPDIWLRANDLTYNNGDLVSQWDDLSGNARHFTAAGANRPVFTTNVNNGKSALAFDGTKGVDRSYTGTGNNFVIAGTVKQNAALFKVWWQNSTNPYFGIQAGNQPVFFQGATLQYTASNTEIFKAWMPLVVRVVGANGTIYCGRNQMATTAGLTPGTMKVAGLGNLTSFKWDGFMQEVFAKSGTLTDAQLGNLIDYMNAQAGIVDPRVIYCYGDSLTAGNGVTSDKSYPSQMQVLMGSTVAQVRNKGIGGTTIQDRSSGDYIAKPANLAFADAAAVRLGQNNIYVAWAGTNDLYYGFSTTNTYNALVSWCQGRRAAGYKVLVGTIIARTEVGGSFTNANAATVNTQIRANWSTFADGLVDFAARSEFSNFANTTYYNVDQVHLTEAGYALVASMVKTAVDAIG